MVKLARLADDVQSVFDDLAMLSVEAAVSRVLDLYERVLGFHAEVGGHFDAVEYLRIELPREFDRDDYQRTLVLFTIYGMYLQVKTLCLLPMLQLCAWRALGRDGLASVGLEADQYVEGLADECVKTACETIAMFERYIAVYPHTPEVRVGRQVLLFFGEGSPVADLVSPAALALVHLYAVRRIDRLHGRPPPAPQRGLRTPRRAHRVGPEEPRTLRSLGSDLGRGESPRLVPTEACRWTDLSDLYLEKSFCTFQAMCRDLLVNFIDEPACPDDNQEVQGMEMRI
jgi:hypothetical protein